MFRSIRTAALVPLLVCALVSPAAAVDEGTPDTTHDSVGALLLHPFPGVFYLVCSGSVVAPAYFLTSAHCLDWADEQGFTAANFVVSFDEDLDGEPDGSVRPDSVVPIRSYAIHPAFAPQYPAPPANDVAMVTLAAPVLGVRPVDLPAEGLLDEASGQGGLNEHSFVNVGYGVDPSERGRFSFSFDGVRRWSTSPYKALTDDFLMLNMQNAATGEGGSCIGDSGSPKFFELDGPRANVVVAVTTGGDRMCRAHNYNVRLDTPQVRAFLAEFVTLP